MGSQRASGRHVARPAARRRARGGVIRAVLSTASLFAGAIAVALAATGGTYALWNAEDITDASTITAGSTGLTINDVTDYTVPSLVTTQLLPGRSVVSPTPLIVKNTGTTPLSMTVSGIFHPVGDSTTVAPHLTIALRQASTCSASPDGAATATMTGPVHFAVGQSISFCLEVGLKATAPSSVQGSEAQFTIALLATQVRS